jgi:hypothetical protein
MTRKKKNPALFLSAGLLIAALAWVLWPSSSAEVEPNKGLDKVLVNRIWIDSIPTTERDKVDVFLMIEEGSFGVFSKSSAYEGDWSAFAWSMENGLRLHMLQSDKTHKVRVRVWKGSRCAPFDYCMDIKGNPRGAKRYGSMEDWIITSDAEANPPQLVQDLFFD